MSYIHQNLFNFMFLAEVFLSGSDLISSELIGRKSAIENVISQITVLQFKIY